MTKTPESCQHGLRTCRGPFWFCGSCDQTYCANHRHVTGKGTNVECVACERKRLDGMGRQVPRPRLDDLPARVDRLNVRDK